MTDKVKHSTSYFHEAIAHAFEMFNNGYEPVMETPFQPRRLGSAFVTNYKPASDAWTEEEEEAITNALVELASKKAGSSVVDKICKQMLDAAFENLDKEEDCNHIDRKAVEQLNQLTIRQKWEINDELDAEFDKLLEQSEPLPKELLGRMQELRDKAEANREKDNGIFDRLVESIESAQNNPEGCVSTIVKVNKKEKLVYTREQLDELYWTDLQEVGYKFGVKGRNRNKLTNAILQAQEK